MAAKIRKNKSKLILLALYAIYITLIVLISTVYIAENEFRGRVDSDNYEYKLKFDTDGKIEHYDVMRTDPSRPGLINLKYTKSSNTLDVETINIAELKIDCRSIAVEKNQEILEESYFDDSNAYKQYFIEKEVFNVIVDADNDIEITYIDVPYPYQVLVDDQIWYESIDYTYKNGRIRTTVPAGDSVVSINFVSDSANAPNARFLVDYEYLVPGAPMTFDATSSTDDGLINDYLWDFGDGHFDAGEVVTHYFDGPGQYGVILTVRDDDGLMDTFKRLIYVKDDNNNSLPDDWEELHMITDPNRDEDGDLLSNLEEYRYGTDPNNPDSDLDDVLDGIEVEKGTDPLDSSSIPDVDKKPTSEENITSIAVAIVAIIIIVILFLYLIILKPKMKRGARRKEKELEELESKKGKKLPLGMPGVKKRMPPKREPPKRPSALEDKLRKPSKPGASRRSKAKLHDLHHRMIDDDMHIPMMDTGLDLPEEALRPPRRTTVRKPSKAPPKPFAKPPKKEPSKSKVVYVFECPTCGARIEEDEDVCPACGEEFED